MDLRRNYLVIDDDKIALKLAASCCHELGLKVYIADTPTEAVDELKSRLGRLSVLAFNCCQDFSFLQHSIALIQRCMPENRGALSNWFTEGSPHEGRSCWAE
jgi:CheY-like chemotaxis protein